MKKQINIAISLTQKHIENGIKSKACICPVALALIDSGLVSRPVVHDEKIIFDFEGRMYTINTPLIAANFIRSFDNDYIVKPFDFELVFYAHSV